MAAEIEGERAAALALVRELRRPVIGTSGKGMKEDDRRATLAAVVDMKRAGRAGDGGDGHPAALAVPGFPETNQAATSEVPVPRPGFGFSVRTHWPALSASLIK